MEKRRARRRRGEESSVSASTSSSSTSQQSDSRPLLKSRQRSSSGRDVANRRSFKRRGSDVAAAGAVGRRGDTWLKSFIDGTVDNVLAPSASTMLLAERHVIEAAAVSTSSSSSTCVDQTANNNNNVQIRYVSGAGHSPDDEFINSVKKDESKNKSALEEATNTNAVNFDVIQYSSSASPELRLSRNTYWLTRVLITRFVAFVYLVAFVVSFNQNPALIGTRGLLPGDVFMRRIAAENQHVLKKCFLAAPSLFWFVNYEANFDFWLTTCAALGVALSLFVLYFGAANAPIMISLWAMYFSIVSVGQDWFWFGWESQLLETGFIAVFMWPMWYWPPTEAFPRDSPCSMVPLYAYRWLIMRIMLGAGLIKLRGDKCWRDLTCMNYHYETQPVPNPISYYLHREPQVIHKFETMSNHFIELVAPWLLLLPFRTCRILGGFFQVFFQCVLIVSGNLSFLNWLTIVPALACFDDNLLQQLKLFTPYSMFRAGIAQLRYSQAVASRRLARAPLYARTFLNLVFFSLVVYLSIPVVNNLVSKHQMMNTNFEPFRLVNTYGAFGSITKQRNEVIIEGTESDDPYDPDAVWHEYEFNCKPGGLARSPCLITPYHYRLDWLMWFAAFEQEPRRQAWMYRLIGKLLVNDPLATSLIAYNPFWSKEPPKFIRARRFHYTFSYERHRKLMRGNWWQRKVLVDQPNGFYVPPVNLKMLTPIYREMGWAREEYAGVREHLEKEPPKKKKRSVAEQGEETKSKE